MAAKIVTEVEDKGEARARAALLQFYVTVFRNLGGTLRLPTCLHGRLAAAALSSCLCTSSVVATPSGRHRCSSTREAACVSGAAGRASPRHNCLQRDDILFFAFDGVEEFSVKVFCSNQRRLEYSHDEGL